jgi:phosphate transport system permease protein
LAGRRSLQELLHGLKRPSIDGLFKLSSLAIAFSVVIVLGFSGIVLVQGSLPALAKFSFSFLTGIQWNIATETFGALPYVLGTAVTSLIAVVVGVPISIGIAIFLTEMAPDSIRVPLSNIIELLAAVPSIIYGLWGLLVFRFWIANYVEAPLVHTLGSIPVFAGSPYGLDFLTAGLILSIMIIPTIASVSREVMMSVPMSQREAAYSIGATRWEVVRTSVISYSRSGIFGAIILGLGRAVGEAMAVTLVIGGAVGPAALPTSLFKPGQTMASIIVNELGEADAGSLHLASLLGIGLILFAFAFTINILAQFLVWKVLKVQGGSVE